MIYKLFEEVALLKDIPEKKLKKGDVATIVEHHPVSRGEDVFSSSQITGPGLYRLYKPDQSPSNRA